MHNSAVSLSPAKKKTRWAWMVGTFFGAGLLRPGPGTWGSAAAALLWYAAGTVFHPGRGGLALLSLAGAAGATAAGIPASTRMERESGRVDPGCVVIDEVAGQWIALIPCRLTLSGMLAGFLFFRFFDILKPWPVRRFEALPEGWGIMFDDVAAGVYALVLSGLLQGWIAK